MAFIIGHDFRDDLPGQNLNWYKKAQHPAFSAFYFADIGEHKTIQSRAHKNLKHTRDKSIDKWKTKPNESIQPGLTAFCAIGELIGPNRQLPGLTIQEKKISVELCRQTLCNVALVTSPLVSSLDTAVSSSRDVKVPRPLFRSQSVPVLISQ